MTSPMYRALTVAGSDSSAGAGIQADLKTFAALGVYGTSVITAVTAQNTLGVIAVEPLVADFVTAQIEAVAGDIDLHATKTGMLATAAIVEAVTAAIDELDLPKVVVDPVLVATSGDPLLDDDGVQVMRTELLPRALGSSVRAVARCRAGLSHRNPLHDGRFFCVGATLLLEATVLRPLGALLLQAT